MPEKTKGEVICDAMLSKAKRLPGAFTHVKVADDITSFKFEDFDFKLIRTRSYRGSQPEPGYIILRVIEDGETTQILRQPLRTDLDEWGVLQRLGLQLYDIFNKRNESRENSVISRLFYKVSMVA